MNHFETSEGCANLRKALRKQMPPEAFQPVPWRGQAGLLAVPVYVALGVSVVVMDLPWWVDLALGVVIGQLVTHVSLVAHEVLHRSVFRSKFWQDVYGWVGFSWYLFGPSLWRAWHVQAHHAHTQEGAADPDSKGTLDGYHQSPVERLVHAVTPGSGTWLSYITPFVLFTFQGQMFLWYYSALPELSAVTINRTQEKWISFTLGAAWLGLGVALGAWDAWCVIGLPMLIANATLMMYISTNHWLRPLTADTNNPFTNTTSVRVPAWMDWLHVSFSYHQEHHIFPQMSPKYAPLLREKLTELAPEAVHAFPLGPTLREIYRTPALYLDATTLVRPDGTGAISLADIEARLRRRTNGEVDAIAAK